MIPKIMYFFWDGRPMPWLRFMTLRSFVKFNPYWKVELWCPKPYINSKIIDLGIDIKQFTLPGIFKSKKLHGAQQSDIFQWCKLYETGGYYSDLDILFINNVFKLYKRSRDKHFMFTFIRYLKIAFMGFEAKSPILKNIIDILAASYTEDPDNYQTVGNIVVYKSLGLSFKNHRRFLDELAIRYPELPYYNYNKYCLFPLDYNKSYKYFKPEHANTVFRKSVVGFHWYGGTPAAQKYEKILTEENYKTHNNILCNKIQELSI
jgi:hypothetical protein